MQDEPNSTEPRGGEPEKSDLKWRILAAIIILTALAALVIKQSF